MKDAWQKLREFSGDIIDAKIGPMNELEIFEIMMKVMESPVKKVEHREYTDLFYSHNESMLLLRTMRGKPVLFFPVLEKGEEIVDANIRVRNIEERLTDDGFAHSAVMYVSYRHHEPFFVFVPFYPEIKNKILPFNEYSATVEMIAYDIEVLPERKYEGARMKQLPDRRRIFYEVAGEVADIKYKETVIDSILPVVVEKKDYERMALGRKLVLRGAMCAYFHMGTPQIV